MLIREVLPNNSYVLVTEGEQNKIIPYFSVLCRLCWGAHPKNKTQKKAEKTITPQESSLLAVDTRQLSTI